MKATNPGPTGARVSTSYARGGGTAVVELASAVGLELSVSHHRSARAGTVTAVATALHLGRTLASYEIVVTDGDGRRLCTARLTCMVIAER